MEKRRYREYLQEFKKQALELLKRGDKSAGQIERELGITPGLLGKWRARYMILEHYGQLSQIGPSDLDAAKAGIRRLQHELSAVEEEREILKRRSISSRENAHEVRLHCQSREDILSQAYVSSAWSSTQRVLCMEAATEEP